MKIQKLLNTCSKTRQHYGEVSQVECEKWTWNKSLLFVSVLYLPEQQEYSNANGTLSVNRCAPTGLYSDDVRTCRAAGTSWTAVWWSYHSLTSSSRCRRLTVRASSPFYESSDFYEHYVLYGISVFSSIPAYPHILQLLGECLRPNNFPEANIVKDWKALIWCASSSAKGRNVNDTHVYVCLTVFWLMSQ